MAVISLVTGASSGLGRDISKLLCKKAHIVYVVARSADKLQYLKKECKNFVGEIRPISGDLTDVKFRKKLIDIILKKSRKIDYLINNAGFGTAIEFEKQPIEDCTKMFELNVLAYEHLTSLVLPSMKKIKKGKIICISSIVAFTPLPYFATYNATKGAVFNFVRSLRYELKGTGVSASVVLPARMKTGFGKQAFKCYKPHIHDTCLKEWNKQAGSAFKVAKKVVKNIDSNYLLILPGIKTKLFYFLTHLPFGYYLVDFLMKYLLGPGMKKNINKTEIDKNYYKH